MLALRTLAGMVLVGAATLGAQDLVPAFPGAEGFGAYALGGRDGDVYWVDNPNPSGSGSFADAIATVPPNGRTIVFGVSGYIHINKARLDASRVTIAGQTAPGDGIGFLGGPLIINGSDIVIRHVRFRYGRRPAGGDCINIGDGVTNVMLDHVSLMFSTDENISSFSKNPRPDRLTFQWSLNAWGLETHSCGGLWDLNHATAHHTLWAHNHTRNPKARPDSLLDWINNVTFDWDIGFILGDSRSTADWKANVVGNYFICPPGNARRVALEKARLASTGQPNFTLHLEGNLFDNNGNETLDGTDVEGQLASGDYRSSVDSIRAEGAQVVVQQDLALTAYKKIVSAAGSLRLDAASPRPIRDEVDTILMQNLVEMRPNHIRNENETGASNGGLGFLKSEPAPADSDGDGMPDDWERTLGWDPDRQDHNLRLDLANSPLTFLPSGAANGYTRLEEYLHFLAIPHAQLTGSSGGQNNSLTVDLRRFVSGFNTEPVRFTVIRSVHGDSTLQSDGCTIEFTPSPEYVGRARVEFKVEDGDGSQWDQVLAVLVMPPSVEGGSSRK